jgi:hypothetical protein
MCARRPCVDIAVVGAFGQEKTERELEILPQEVLLQIKMVTEMWRETGDYKLCTPLDNPEVRNYKRSTKVCRVTSVM